MIKWAKRLILVPIIIFAIIGFVFIFNPKDVSPLSLPCFSDCHDCVLIPFSGVCDLGISPEDQCSQDCRMRDFKCSFDLDFKEECMNCFSDCSAEGFEDSSELKECFSKCPLNN